MEQIFVYLPKELFELIFSYCNKPDLDNIFELPEFGDIANDNYFWNNQIRYTFPRYYLSHIKGYAWKSVYHGLNILLNTKSEEVIKKFILEEDFGIIRVILSNFPNLFELYLNYKPEVSSNITKVLKDNNIDTTIIRHIYGKVQKIIHSLIHYVNMNYPSTSKYLIQNDLITGKNKNLERDITWWILDLDYVPLIDKLSTNDTDNVFEHIFNKVITLYNLGPHIFTYLMEKQFPNTTFEDYLRILMFYEIERNVVDIIYDKINSENNVEITDKFIYATFKFIIDNDIHLRRFRYIWNKFRGHVTSDERKELHDLAMSKQDYLNEDDLYEFDDITDDEYYGVFM
jgi:hypothetical protein